MGVIPELVSSSTGPDWALASVSGRFPFLFLLKNASFQPSAYPPTVVGYPPNRRWLPLECRPIVFQITGHFFFILMKQCAA